MNLEEIKKNYEELDNHLTVYPIYIVVQRLVFIGVVADGDYLNYGETKTQYYHHSFENFSYNTLEEAENDIREYYEGHADEEIQDELTKIQELNCGYMWLDDEIFLTEKGADEYIRCNGHNLGKIRKYVKHFSTRNKEMRFILEYLGFKTKD